MSGNCTVDGCSNKERRQLSVCFNVYGMALLVRVGVCDSHRHLITVGTTASVRSRRAVKAIREAGGA